MPNALAPIPLGAPIVEAQHTITEFFRLRWQQLQDNFLRVPTIATLERLAQTAALATTAVHTTISGGLYRISWYLRRTVNDGVSSSATITLGWTESGAPLTEVETALTQAAGLSQQSGSKLVQADANTDLTIALAYASNTPGAMAWRLNVSIEQLV